MSDEDRDRRIKKIKLEKKKGKYETTTKISTKELSTLERDEEIERRNTANKTTGQRCQTIVFTTSFYHFLKLQSFFFSYTNNEIISVCLFLPQL